MNNKKNNYLNIASRARKVFVDEANYSDYEMSALFLLIKDVYNGNLCINSKSIIAKNLIAVLNELPYNKQQIIKLRYYDLRSLREVAQLLSLSPEGTRQNEMVCLKILRKRLVEYSIDEQIRVYSLRSKILQYVKKGEISQCDFSIDELHMETRHINSLKRSGINTVGQLIFLTRDDLVQIAGIGKEGAKQIIRKLGEFFPYGPNGLQIFNDIEELHLTPLYFRQLKANGINKISQIYFYSEKDFALLVGLTEGGKKQIIARMKEKFPSWSLRDDFSKTTIDNVHIYYLRLSCRSYNGLMKQGIDKIGQLMEMSDKDLIKIPKLGDGCVKEIRTKVNLFISKRT